MATEYAVLEGGEIVNVVTTSGGRMRAQELFPNSTVVPLDSLPLDVKRRYRFWNERP